MVFLLQTLSYEIQNIFSRIVNSCRLLHFGLKLNENNCADTSYGNIFNEINDDGCPFRIRGDQHSENALIIEFLYPAIFIGFIGRES